MERRIIFCSSSFIWRLFALGTVLIHRVTIRDMASSADAEAHVDIKTMYPGLTGRSLQDKIWDEWVINKECVVTRPYFDS
eukprot:9466922-Pyramimonas_sp.AAC.1